MIWPSPPVRSAEEIHGFSIPALHSVSRIPAGASAAATVGAGGPRTGPAGGDGGAKPGTVTGVQVLLWTFLALDALGEAFSIIDLIGHCHPIGLVALTYTLHVTVQSLLTPVHLARGKRRAWIWSLVSAVVGVRFSAAGVVFGILHRRRGAATGHRARIRRAQRDAAGGSRARGRCGSGSSCTGCSGARCRRWAG